MPESNEKGRVSFKEVAKLAMTPEATQGPAEERTENSGLINLTAIVTAETTSRTETKSETKIQDNSVIPVSTRMPARLEKKQSDGRVWIALATGIALGTLVAGTVFALRGAGSSHESRVVATSRASASATLPLVPVANPSAPIAHAASDNHAVGPSAVARKVDPPAPVLAAASHASNIPPRDLSTLPASNAPPSTGAPLAKTATTGAAPSSPSQMPPVQSNDNTLEALIKHAVGPSVPTPPRTATMPESAPAPAGNVPVKPALGAVQGAVGTVLPGARSCLGPDDPVSRATITFKSDGSVQDVTVSGHASGEPAEECIRSRLMAARLPPFASPTFTWTVTVRPAG